MTKGFWNILSGQIGDTPTTSKDFLHKVGVAEHLQARIKARIYKSLVLAAFVKEDPTNGKERFSSIRNFRKYDFKELASNTSNACNKWLVCAGITRTDILWFWRSLRDSGHLCDGQPSMINKIFSLHMLDILPQMNINTLDALMLSR